MVVMLSNHLYLPVENRGGSDQAEGGAASHVEENCLGSVKVISPGNAAGQCCRWQEWYPSRWLVRQYPSQSRSIGVSEFQDKKSCGMADSEVNAGGSDPLDRCIAHGLYCVLAVLAVSQTLMVGYVEVLFNMIFLGSKAIIGWMPMKSFEIWIRRRFT